MNFETVADVYSANEKARQHLVETVSGLNADLANLPTENGKWTVAGLVEHLAKVGDGMSKICYKLLSSAHEEGKTSDGKIQLSKSFVEALKQAHIEEQKFEAPEIVAPTDSQTIAESLAALEKVTETLEKLRPLFESVNGTEHTFPHPYFGPMSAQDWLVLLGVHETRHTIQIEKILANQ